MGGSDDEIMDLASNLFGGRYIEGSGIVLGGVTYKVIETGLDSLVAESGKTGIVAREI